MKATKIMILSIAVLVILSMILFMAQLLLRKLKTADKRIPTMASGIWFISVFLSGALLTSKTVFVFSEAIDNIYKINPADSLFNIFKTGSVLTGITIVWRYYGRFYCLSFVSI
jgi:hypothetical protein